MLNFLNMFTPYKPGWTEKAQRVWWCQAYRYSRKIRILSNKVASGTFCAKNKHGFRFLCSTLFRSTNGAIEGFYRWLSMDVGKNPTWSEIVGKKAKKKKTGTTPFQSIRGADKIYFDVLRDYQLYENQVIVSPFEYISFKIFLSMNISDIDGPLSMTLANSNTVSQLRLILK